MNTDYNTEAPERIEEPAQEELPQFEYASPSTRVFNHIIDIIAYYVIIFLFGWVTIVIFNKPEIIEFLSKDADTISDKLLQYLLLMIIYVATYAITEGATGGYTLGKLITGSKVLREDGSKITWTDALKRSLVRIVPFEPISILWGALWHDKWTNTIVVKRFRYRG